MKTYRLSEVVSSHGNWVMYHLKDELESLHEGRADADTELPPDLVQE